MKSGIVLLSSYILLFLLESLIFMYLQSVLRDKE